MPQQKRNTPHFYIMLDVLDVYRHKTAHTATAKTSRCGNFHRANGSNEKPETRQRCGIRS